MTHDPLCVELDIRVPDSAADCLVCDLFARVREDERMIRQEEKSISFMEGRESALRDAVEAVKALPDTGGWTTPDGVIHEIDRAAAVAAIEALGGEQ